MNAMDSTIRRSRGVGKAATATRGSGHYRTMEYYARPFSRVHAPPVADLAVKAPRSAQRKRSGTHPLAVR